MIGDPDDGGTGRGEGRGVRGAGHRPLCAAARSTRCTAASRSALEGFLMCDVLISDGTCFLGRGGGFAFEFERERVGDSGFATEGV